MFFAAFIGYASYEPTWREALQQHAAWFGLSAHPYARTLGDGRVFAFGWVSVSAPDTDALVRDDGHRLVIIPLDTPTRDVAMMDNPPRGFHTTATRLEVSLVAGEVRITMPVMTLEKFYWARVADGWLLGNDLRILIRLAGLDLAERAVYAIFQYSSIPSPWTISRSVSRVMPGHILTVFADAGEARLQRFFRVGDLAEEWGGGDAGDYVAAAMDAAIARTQPPVAVHFSGGVDSALVAARLAALGRRDARLQRFTPGPSDPFHDLSPKMAAHLNLPFEEVYWNPSDIVPVLESLAQEYATPFADPATLPTLMLIRAMARWPVQPTAVLTGTGAQSLFASGAKAAKFRRVYSVPRALRRLVGAAYPLGLWRSASKVGWFVGAVNKAASLPPEYAAAGGHSSLDGFAFRMPPDVRNQLEGVALAEINALAGDVGLAERIAVSGVVRNSMCLCGERPFDPLRRRGIRTVLPFTEPETVRAAFSLSWEQKCPHGVSKGLLKELLARQLPREWVYVPKGRFLLPYYETFSHPETREFVRDVVLSRGNPVLALCEPKHVEEVFRRVEAGESVHVGVRPFAWAVTFLSAWLDGLRRV
ncbi:MAG: hypothetical protein Kow00123_03330 [Anaerolineales bacterium]